MRPPIKILIGLGWAIFLLSILSVLFQLFTNNERHVSNFNYVIGEQNSHQNPCHEKAKKYHHLTEFIENAACTVLGGLVAGGIGVWAYWYQKGRDAKYEFKIFISLKKGRIPAAKGFWNYFVETKTEVRDAISKINVTLGLEKIERMERLWDEYNHIPYEDLKDDNIDSESSAKLEEIAKAPKKLIGGEKLRYFFDKFIEIAS